MGFRFSRSIRLHRQGVALISTLAILSIVTILLVAYVSSVTADRQSTQSYSQGLRAEEVAEGGLAQIVGQLEGEIMDTAKSTNFSMVTGSSSNTIYRPLANSNAVPERMSILPSPSADPTLAEIVKISLPGAPVYTGTGNGGTNFASTASTTNSSLNGHHITLARWSKPVLVSTTNNFPIPNWVLVGRQGPITPGAQDLSASLGNQNAVLGRYAYVVYDTSGLLDINVAGYAPSLFNTPPTKGFLSWADLTQLGINASDATSLVQWRNAQSSQNATNYATYVTNASASGFLQVATGDTAFLGRQELINFASQSQFTTLTNALPYLTTFSRELNGPVWSPSTNAPGGAPFDYLTHRDLPTTTTHAVEEGYTAKNATPNLASVTVYDANVFALNPRVQIAYTNNMGILRNVGEPLLKYRFPLDKLALLEKQGTVGLAGSDVSNIQKYFGLDLVTTGTYPSSGLYRHWTYPTASRTGNAAAGRILTLSEVAALNPPRDPDFFELLQAGILTGSIGQSARTDLSSPYGATDPANSGPNQIIQIGANIIDQWDADSYPTQITFTNPTLPSGTIDFYGVEDLPYIKEVFFKVFTDTTNFYPLVYMQLWNPHQTNAASASSSRPTTFRLAPAATDWIYMNLITTNETVLQEVMPQTFYSAMPNGGIMQFSVGLNSYREPSLITNGINGTPTMPLNHVANHNPTGPGSSVPIVGVTFSGYALPTGTVDANAEPINNAIYPLQYQLGNNWYTYTTLAGLQPPAGVNAGSGAKQYYGMGSGNNFAMTTNTVTANGASYARSDPRTTRWGLAGTDYAHHPGDYPTNAFTTLCPSPTSIATNYEAFTQSIPFGAPQPSGGTPAYYREDLWAGNTNAGNAAYSDLDGTQRLGDAAFSYPNHSPFYTGDVSRPQVLNRPFTSVADLGYTFRDTPWKTLDFSSPTSADSALLDLFTLSDGPVLAGHVNVNAAPAPVLLALLSGTSLSTTNTSPISSTSITQIANALRDAVTNTATGHGPFLSRADLVTGFMTNSAMVGVSANNLKSERESVMRALAEPANTRTWNFMIDIIAQSGHYPLGTRDATQFVVEGERRYWLHIAIDRYTGQIVDQQLEVVTE